MSPDGQRVLALFSDYPTGYQLAIRTPAEWSSLLLGSPSLLSDHIVRMSHTASGALVITVPAGRALPGRPNANIYAESP
jgi:hypothetical protein